jgi:hypothetical protein
MREAARKKPAPRKRARRVYLRKACVETKVKKPLQRAKPRSPRPLGKAVKEKWPLKERKVEKEEDLFLNRGLLYLKEHREKAKRVLEKEIRKK